MRKVRVAFAATMALSLMLPLIGSAAAASGTYETREDFIYQLDKSLGIQPVYPTTPDFADVTPSNPYYGYIEAADQRGITNGIAQGVFGPTLSITRAEAAKYLVIAFGGQSIAAGITSTTFKDNAEIPTALVGYVGAAAQLHLMEGYPTGYFYPDNDLTITQEGYLIQHLLAAMSSVSLKVSASATDAAPGQIVTLSAEGVTSTGATVPAPDVAYSVSGTNASAAVITGNEFAATSPGSYTIEGRSGGATGTVQVAIYGTAAGLKVVTPQNVVANGESSESVQVEVVDSSGNVVANSTDQIGLQTDSNAALGLLGAGGTVDPANTTETSVAVNGVATFSGQAGLVAGSVTNLTAADETNVSVPSVTAQVTAVAQVPTAISLTAVSPYIDANGTNGSDALSAVVNDQVGYPMISGSYTVSFSASGPANFSGSSTAAGVYYGPSKAPAVATLGDVQGSTGTVTVTASATTVTSATATLTAVIAGAPAQVAISEAQTITADQSATYTVSVEDSHGYPVPLGTATSPATIDLSASDPSATISPSVAFTGQASQTFSVSDTAAGSYTLTASDPTGTLTSGTSTLTVTPGALAGVMVTPSTQSLPGYPVLWISASSPTATITAQITDDHGNAIAQSGVEVDFYLLPDGNTGTASLTSGANSVDSSSGPTVRIPTHLFPSVFGEGPVVGYTDSSGVATATLQMQPYLGDEYFVQADVLNGAEYADAGIFTLAQNTPSNDAVSLTSGGNSVFALTGGTTYDGAVTQTDANGNTVDIANLCSGVGFPPSDEVSLTLGGTGSASISGPSGVSFDASTGVATIDMCTDPAGAFTVTADHAGSLTISAQSPDVYGAQTRTFSYTISPGTAVGSVGFFSGGAELTESAPLTVAAGQNAAVTVSPLDAGGNVIVATNPVPVSFAVYGGSGVIRNSPTGPNLPADYATIDFGQTGATFYFVNTTNQPEEVWFGGSIGAIAITSPGTVPAQKASTPYTLTWTLTSGGNPVVGVAVSFGITATNGTAVAQLSSSMGTTNAQGQVSVTANTPGSWAAGDIDTVTLTTQGTSPLTSTATLTDAVPQSISSNADGGMNYTAGSSTAVTFTVMTTAGTTAPAGMPVTVSTIAGGSNTGTWGVSQTVGGAPQSSISVTTDASGQVSVYVTDTMAGDSGTITATANGYPSVTDTTGTITIVPGTVTQIASTAVSSGGTYDVTAGSNTSIDLTPEDPYGNPVANTAIALSYTTTAGTPTSGPLSASSGTTGTYTLSYSPGTSASDLQSVTATAGTATYSFNVQVVAAAPTALVFQSTTGSLNGSGQAEWDNVEITDQYGNPVSGLGPTPSGNFYLQLNSSSGPGYAMNLSALGGGYYDIWTTATGLSSGSGQMISGQFGGAGNSYGVSW